MHRHRTVYLGYVNAAAKVGWAIGDNGVWQLKPAIFSHKESVEELGGVPQQIRVIIEPMEIKDANVS